MNYSAKGDIKKRGKDTEDGPNDSSGTKKRFVWPEYLHREFISAVFDVGLNLVNSKELGVQLSKDIPPEAIRSHIQKFRSFRKRTNAPLRFNDNSNNNLLSLNTSSYYLDNNRLPVPPGLSSNSVLNGSNSGLLDDNLSLVASEDYRNIYDIDTAAGDVAASDSEIAVQVLALSAEIAAVDATIASQTTYIQSLSVSVVQQMKLYSSLVDTLMLIDPRRAAEHVSSPSYLNSSRYTNMGAAATGTAGSFEGGYMRGSTSHNNLMTQQQQQQQQPSPYDRPGGGMQRAFPSHDSLANVSSEQIITSMRTAIASPFHSRNSQSSDGDYQQTHLLQQQQQQHPGSFHHNQQTSGSASAASMQARSEFSAIFEMKAQMDLHRRLFERKEDQLVGHYFYDGSTGGNTFNNNSNNGNMIQQQQQQYGGSCPPSPRGGAAGGGIFSTAGIAMNQPQQQQQLPYVSSMGSFNGESYSYSVQPTAQQIQQQQQAHMMRMMSQNQQQQMIQQYPLTSNNDNSGGSSSSSAAGGVGVMRGFDRLVGAPAFNLSSTSARPPVSYHSNHVNSDANGALSSGGADSAMGASGSLLISESTRVGADASVSVSVGATTSSSNAAGTWEDAVEFEEDLFSFLINNSPERTEGN